MPVVLLAPGQGAQVPGLLEPWLADPAAAARVDRWSQRTGLDLAALGCTADAAALADTAVTQPVLTAAALLSARAALAGPLAGVPLTVVGGHSVGELSAAALAGVLDDDDAVALAAARGAAMARAAARQPSGLAAVLGGDPAVVRAAAAQVGAVIAVDNGGGQLVVGGTDEALRALPAALAARAGSTARVRPLPVAGAFHTELMRPAVPALRAALAQQPLAAAAVPVLGNADGSTAVDPAEIADRLVAQLTGPVRFDRCIAALPAVPVVELAPGGTLVALLRRQRPDLAAVALRSPADLAAVAALPGLTAPQPTSRAVPARPSGPTTGPTTGPTAARAGDALIGSRA